MLRASPCQDNEETHAMRAACATAARAARRPAHDAAEWIQRGGYKNAIGELCCGERDCRRDNHAPENPLI
jgi:hypothetical protein